MKKLNQDRRKSILIAVLAFGLVAAGCSRRPGEELTKDDASSDNIVITETGEVLEKDRVDIPVKLEPIPTPTSDPESELEAEIITPEIELVEPEIEQVITEADQIAPAGGNLQLVFLGDSIFDGSRDGTGIPYLTSVQCDADVYNLSIGGTSASIEVDEQIGSDQWTSRSLVGVVKAMTGDISTDVFEGTRTKEILDNPDIDFSQTDYFIIEYGLNDFFRGVAQSDPESDYNIKTYAGALRYAVSALRELAPDATIILCAPNYAQFYDGNWMIGDGNTVNNGNGTLFDYKGTCNYVANESRSEFFNAYQDLGIDGYTAEEYLEDGVHLTEAGRHLYADALAEKILKFEETKNN